MLSRLLKKEEIQTSRQYNLDLIKALAIICMVICHAVIRFSLHLDGYEDDFWYLFGKVFIASYLAAAHAFMFAMGVGMAFSKKNRPADLIIRGIRLYIMAYILNFFRYGIYTIAEGLITGRFRGETLYSILSPDILHFAGIALIVTGLLRKLKLNEIHICVVGVILSAAGAPLAFVFQGGEAAQYLLGHFVVTSKLWSCFVFFNWYVFVAFGLLFGAILRRAEDLDRFYGAILRVSFPVMALYYVLSIVFGPYFMTKNGWYYAVSLPEAAGFLSIDLTLLSVFYFLLKKVRVERFSPFIGMSRNITAIYCIHWCLIGFIDSVFCYVLGVRFSYLFIYLIGIALIFISAGLAGLSRKTAP